MPPLTPIEHDADDASCSFSNANEAWFADLASSDGWARERQRLAPVPSAPRRRRRDPGRATRTKD